ncbi:hypothetical protein M9H77_08853 [Catharanthus roseus]|uniref:Uncharacterized protein n=1 Tax=Catharanthus roseus TaxID=4058 RepID=A0ACC0BYX5_CATRO|nr:hypothetical protein M9H77_08853 [Catharanthus roseus]
MGYLFVAAAQPLVDVLGIEMAEFATEVCRLAAFSMESDYTNIVAKICTGDVNFSLLGICTKMFKDIASSLPLMGLDVIRRNQNKGTNRLASFSFSLSQIIF